MANCMQTKTACCGCDLRTGTMILVVLIGLIAVPLLYNDLTSSSSYGPKRSNIPIVCEIVACVSCIAAIFAIKTNQRTYLIPFILVIIFIFIVVTIITMALLLLVVGVGSAWESIAKANSLPAFMDTAFASQNNGGHGQSSVKTNVDVSIGPFTIITLIISVIIIAIFLHFVKVTCSLYAEMGKPNGQVFQPMLPHVASFPLGYPTPNAPINA